MKSRPVAKSCLVVGFALLAMFQVRVQLSGCASVLSGGEGGRHRGNFPPHCSTPPNGPKN